MSQDDFLKQQLAFSKVQDAANEYGNSLVHLFREKQLNFPSKQLYIRMFKQERTLEIWASDNVLFQLMKTYPFTETSGKPGPKQREGDLQIPEGFYQIERFNPMSKFHLSFKINYPNIADSLRNKEIADLGGDIYIHGGNKTKGCVPVGDENISELYWLCLNFQAGNAPVFVHIFPCKMEEENIKILTQLYPENNLFWKSIQPMYRFFETHQMLGEVTGADDSGNYQLAIPWD